MRNYIGTLNRKRSLAKSHADALRILCAGIVEIYIPSQRACIIVISSRRFGSSDITLRLTSTSCRRNIPDKRSIARWIENSQTANLPIRVDRRIVPNRSCPSLFSSRVHKTIATPDQNLPCEMTNVICDFCRSLSRRWFIFSRARISPNFSSPKLSPFEISCRSRGWLGA